MNTTTMTQNVKATQEGAWIDIPAIDIPEYARQHQPEGVESLSVDMGKNGQLQNIVLVRKTDGRYECVIGNGRLEAAKKLGWPKIRADVKEALSEVQKLGMVVSENQERQEASPFYTGMLYARMLEASGQTQEEFAQELGKDQTVISRYLALAKVPAEVWKEHQSQLTSMRQCLEIAKVPDLEHQKKLAEACAREGLTGAAAKKRAQALKNGEIAETPASKEKAPSAPFTFAWKGNGLMVKGRLFTPHTESIGQYVNELTDAFDRFMEAEKAHTVAQAA